MAGEKKNRAKKRLNGFPSVMGAKPMTSRQHKAEQKRIEKLLITIKLPPSNSAPFTDDWD